MTDFETFDLGRVALQSGATLPDMLLSYKTYGRLNAARDNAIVYPTFYSGSHVDNEWLIGERMGLDPREYFIISRGLRRHCCWIPSSRTVSTMPRRRVECALQRVCLPGGDFHRRFYVNGSTWKRWGMGRSRTLLPSSGRGIS